MAIIWSEGFDNQNAAADCLNGVLSSITGSFALGAGTTVQTAGGAVTGRAVYLTSTAIAVAAVCTKDTPHTVQGYTHNNILLPQTTGADDYNMWWAFYDVLTGGVQVVVVLDGATGTFTSWSGWAPYTGNGSAGGGTLLGTSAAGVVAPSAFTAIEIGVKIDAAAGFVSIRANGLAIPGASVSGVDTQTTGNAFFNQVQYGLTMSAGTPSYTGRFDDFYIGDSTGSAYNSFINPGYIWDRFATSNVSVQFTPLANANWQEISETQMDGDTSYNVSGSTGNTDLFSSTGSIASGYAPLFVKLQQASRADNTLGRLSENLLVSGSATFTGASNTKGTIYSYQDDYVLNDPATSGTWTLASIAASEFGYVCAG